MLLAASLSPPYRLYTGNTSEIAMSSSQKRAITNHRCRLSERGLARFEVLGLAADRVLIRSLARRLAEDRPTDRIARTVRTNLQSLLR